jgi:hypothetical protein
MERITTRQDLEVFASRLVMAGIEIPENVKLVVDLNTEEYAKFTLMHNHLMFTRITYNSPSGIKFKLNKIQDG